MKNFTKFIKLFTLVLTIFTFTNNTPKKELASTQSKDKKESENTEKIIKKEEKREKIQIKENLNTTIEKFLEKHNKFLKPDGKKKLGVRVIATIPSRTLITKTDNKDLEAYERAFQFYWLYGYRKYKLEHDSLKDYLVIFMQYIEDVEKYVEEYHQADPVSDIKSNRYYKCILDYKNDIDNLLHRTLLGKKYYDMMDGGLKNALEKFKKNINKK